MSEIGDENVVSIADLLKCPNTGSAMRLDDGAYVSVEDSAVRFPIEEGIVRAVVLDGISPHDVTETVKSFYEEYPFPDYEDMETMGSLIQKSRSRGFPEMLNRSIPPHATVLEAGCGTGQLGNFLSIAGRRVLSGDICLNSLRLAQQFKTVHGLTGVKFAQMNLFRMPLQPEKFDVVICTGVLHHTSDPLGGFRGLLPLVKPGGFVVIGLYNFLGRMKTRLRRTFLVPLFGDRFAGSDPHVKLRNLTGRKKRAWFMDQYRHPHESVHSLGEVLDWFDNNGVRFIRSLPSTVFGGSFQLEYHRSLFQEESRGSRTDRLLSQLGQMLDDDTGGLFIMIGQKG